MKPVIGTPNFPELEKSWLKKWYETGTVKSYLEKNNNSSKKFFFLDGPITANNPMGVHHAWGRTYKDLWQKFHNLLGYRQRFQNGFDCQGLWVEVEVEKEIGIKTKKDIENLVPGDKKASIAKFVQMCKDRVIKFSGIQTEQTKRLGNFMHWDNSYFTMSSENNYMIWYFLKKCYENGWVYKGHESVPWCPRCETAISQHEMLTEDYKELVHDSVYVALPVVGKDEYLLVWTTTPWTIPANIAVAVDAKKEYSLVEIAGKKYWVIKEAVERVFKENKPVKTAKGKELVGLQYAGPFDELPAVAKVAKEHSKTFHTVVATDDQILPISTEEGTGLVHTAVSAGVEDFQLGKKYGLPMIPVIADNADYLDGFAEFSGKNAKKHPELIIDFLKSHEGGKFLFSVEKYKHRYPACWRCKTELVWKVADEWYIAMDKPPQSTDNSRSTIDKLTLRERMVKVAKLIHWMPEFGLDRELDWLKNMHDWLISKKNRYWGLALPIYECKDCGNFEVIGGYAELKERAVSGWEQFAGKTPHKPFIDDVTVACSKCGKEITRIDDVGNPWLDAGIVPFSTLIDPETKEVSYITDKKYFKEWFPANFITESFPGQFKNWFYAMIAMSTVLEDSNPFERVLGYASLLAEDGRPMHKSWGNSIEFNEGADKIGVDVMRWMYARTNPAENMLFGYKKADEVRRQFYLILWNSYKFFIDNAVHDHFDLRPSTLDINSGHILDKWIVSRLHWLISHVEEQMKKYDARTSAQEIEMFVNDLSTWYIRRSRDRVGREFYETCQYVFANLSIIISPFMPFISEEMYSNLSDEKSVHLTEWPKARLYDETLLAQMEEVRKIVEEGHRIRKELNIKVRQPLASLSVNGKDLADFEQLIMDELNVKKVIWREGELSYDTTITEELKLEGELRDLLRAVQQERKEKGKTISDMITLTVPSKFKQFEEQIVKKVLAREIKYGDSVVVE